MIFQLLKLPHTLYHFLIQAAGTPYLWNQKRDIFFTLTQLWIKIIFKGKDAPCTQKIFGFKVSAPHTVTLFDMYREIFVQRAYNFDAHITTPHILDCGANIGLSVLYFKFLYPEATIIAFEPSPAIFFYLETNVKSNNLEGITLYQTALSGKTETSHFDVSTQGGLNNAFASQKDHTIAVETQMLSTQLLKQPADLVKMDIEGAETEVIDELEGAHAILQARQYIIEYHHDCAKSLSTFLHFFERHGFPYFVKNTFPFIQQKQSILFHFLQPDQK